MLVLDEEQRLLGTLSDGDLRRALAAQGEAALALTVDKLMNYNKPFPRTVTADLMARARPGPRAPEHAASGGRVVLRRRRAVQAFDALKVMERAPPVTYLPVLRGDRILEGLITIHDMALLK